MHVLQLWLLHSLHWMQSRSAVSRPDQAKSKQQKTFAVHTYEALGGGGAPAGFREGPQSQSSAAEGSGAQEEQKYYTATKELPLPDQRSKLVAQIRRLTAAVDKQQELLTNVATKCRNCAGNWRRRTSTFPGCRRRCFRHRKRSRAWPEKATWRQQRSSRDRVADLESSADSGDSQEVSPYSVMDTEEDSERNAKARKRGVGHGTPPPESPAQELLATGEPSG
eukprot:6462766-Amphidinium_carterae.1